MSSHREGELVTVADEHGTRDGIVVQIPSKSKVVVAVQDAARGPVLRTFDAKALAERAEEGEHDDALRRLIRRTPSAGPSQKGGPSGPGGGSRGHTRSPAHRATGR
jgi:hypothetical protein